MFDNSGYYNNNTIYNSIDSGKDGIGSTPAYRANKQILEKSELLINEISNQIAPVKKGIVIATPTNVASSSAVLRSNMIARGLTFRYGEEAHHIVAGNSRLFNRSRQLLKQRGIDINSSVNGVALSGSRRTRMTKNGFQWGATQDMYALNHRASGLHSKQMAAYLERGLERTKTKAEAESFLKQVALSIKDGSITKKAGLK